MEGAWRRGFSFANHWFEPKGVPRNRHASGLALKVFRVDHRGVINRENPGELPTYVSLLPTLFTEYWRGVWSDTGAMFKNEEFVKSLQRRIF